MNTVPCTRSSFTTSHDNVCICLCIVLGSPFSATCLQNARVLTPRFGMLQINYLLACPWPVRNMGVSERQFEAREHDL